MMRLRVQEDKGLGSRSEDSKVLCWHLNWVFISDPGTLSDCTASYWCGSILQPQTCLHKCDKAFLIRWENEVGRPARLMVGDDKGSALYTVTSSKRHGPVPTFSPAIPIGMGWRGSSQVFVEHSMLQI